MSLLTVSERGGMSYLCLKIMRTFQRDFGLDISEISMIILFLFKNEKSPLYAYGRVCKNRISQKNSFLSRSRLDLSYKTKIKLIHQELAKLSKKMSFLVLESGFLGVLGGGVDSESSYPQNLSVEFL